VTAAPAVPRAGPPEGTPEGPTPTPDPRAILRFFRLLYPDPEVLPPGGRLVVWSGRTKRAGWFRPDEDGLARAAAYTARLAAGADLYVGLGLQDVGAVRAVPAARRPFVRGKAETVLAIPALWCEVDLAGPGHKAHDLPETLEQALGAVAARLPLPFSLLIGSGGGVHGYALLKEPWILDTAGERRRAGVLLARFQATIREAFRLRGWRLDPTADLARVLRPPGTCNHKVRGRPRPVRQLDAAGVRYDPDDVEPYLLGEAELEAPPPAGAAPGQRRGSTESSFPPAELAPIEARCAFMRLCRDRAPTLPEPYWYAALTIIVRCRDGEALAHLRSRDYPGYSQAETTKKAQHALAAPGPVTCAFVADPAKLAFPGCARCPFAGAVTSPLQLGRPGPLRGPSGGPVHPGHLAAPAGAGTVEVHPTVAGAARRVYVLPGRGAVGQEAPR
jgi:putative DNA primase/helicase